MQFFSTFSTFLVFFAVTASTDGLLDGLLGGLLGGGGTQTSTKSGTANVAGNSGSGNDNDGALDDLFGPFRTDAVGSVSDALVGNDGNDPNNILLPLLGVENTDELLGELSYVLTDESRDNGDGGSGNNGGGGSGNNGGGGSGNNGGGGSGNNGHRRHGGHDGTCRHGHGHGHHD